MLDTETKRRIDTARDILVGKVPDPKSQVEQITIALIYKFMDDMDKESIEFGGNASFFSGDYEKYSWSNIFDPRLGGHEMLNLYSEAIINLNINPSIPQLFRDIFKNAYLPYRDPETLKLFLKTINEFTYDHSERLGDAFEYLLSVLSSQGDAGQFRTPRHIIDFIVEALDPKKNESILDPACGTAGFLISSYKHIVEQNTKPNLNPEQNGKSRGDLLTPADRKKLMNNFAGYDISPDMVRLSLVNMYLHNFTSPKIYEYDTLTSEDKWDEYFDIIMANPPFMTPKGGIKPHKKFSMQANRSEVLFVDYIAEHINPVTGRAGVIVPEGIIFQSANAYKSLRKLLVENNFLYAVVSLPAGIFQPYSGVKTSILFMDKAIAKKTDKILFIKAENDGYSLGAQRKEIEKNDLTSALDILKAWRKYCLNTDSTDFIDSLDFKTIQNQSNQNNQVQSAVLTVSKSVIAKNGDYNLSFDRYRINDDLKKIKFEMVELGEVCEFIRGVVYSKDDEISENGFKVLRANNINLENGKLDLKDVKQISKTVKFSEKQKLIKGDIFICTASGSSEHIGKVAFIENNIDCYFGGFMGAIRSKDNILPKYLFYQLRNLKFNEHLNKSISGANIKNLKLEILNSFQIPLPPLSVQQEIVAKIENYQKIIDGAKQIVTNYKPQIDIDPDWEMVELGEVCEVNPENVDPSKFYGENEFVYIDISSVENGTGNYSFDNLVKGIEAPSRARRKVYDKDVLISTVRPNLKAFALLKNIPESTVVSTGFAVLRCKGKILPKFIYELAFCDIVQNQMISQMGKGAYPSINQTDVENLKIPIPSLEIQQEIVSRIENEQKLVDSSKELIKIFEQKIKDEIGKLWE